jgi:hypothetical protein
MAKKVVGMWERLAELLSALLEESKDARELTRDIPTFVMVRAFLGFLSLGSYERLKIEKKVGADE